MLQDDSRIGDVDSRCHKKARSDRDQDVLSATGGGTTATAAASYTAAAIAEDLGSGPENGESEAESDDDDGESDFELGSEDGDSDVRTTKTESLANRFFATFTMFLAAPTLPLRHHHYDANRPIHVHLTR
jgi:hypothetical protein